MLIFEIAVLYLVKYTIVKLSKLNCATCWNQRNYNINFRQEIISLLADVSYIDILPVLETMRRRFICPVNFQNPTNL